MERGALTRACFPRSGLETLQQNRRHSMFFQTVNLSEMVMCLEDLINYFAQPDDLMGTHTHVNNQPKMSGLPNHNRTAHTQSTKRNRTASGRCATDRTCSRRRASSI